MSEQNQNDISAEAVDVLHKAYSQLQEQIRKVIVGQDEVIEQLLIGLFSQGHVLLEGVPGLAKTLMVSTLARSLSMTFSRIQFTPDLMPADITGTDILQENRTTGQREFRFIPGPLFKVFVKYPTFEEERQIARQTTSNFRPEVQPVLTGEQVLQIQTTVRQVPVSDHVINYTLAIVRQTRVREPGTPQWINDWLGWGAGPRAVQNLLLGAKTRALLSGRTTVSTDDIQKLAGPVLRHRIVPNFTAQSEGITSDKVIERLIQETPARESELTSDPGLGKIFAA